jgi:hypothetical protein
VILANFPFNCARTIPPDHNQPCKEGFGAAARTKDWVGIAQSVIGDRKLSRLRGGSPLAKQGAEACLLEVVVAGQCFSDAALGHDDERDAVGE